jgi:4-hydroxy-3-polyprenylbenzoate decarboxylase
LTKKLVVAIGGSSGSIYARLILDKLAAMGQEGPEVGMVMSDNAKFNWEYELKNKDYLNYPFKLYEKNDFHAPFASGSAHYDTMIVCPCSAGLMGRIANGISNDLTTRAADVILKERRKLIVVLRETPLNLIHLRNMTTLTETGGIICPATPSFYSHPESLEELALTVVDRVLDLCGLPIKTYRWGEKSN